MSLEYDFDAATKVKYHDINDKINDALERTIALNLVAFTQYLVKPQKQNSL